MFVTKLEVEKEVAKEVEKYPEIAVLTQFACKDKPHAKTKMSFNLKAMELLGLTPNAKNANIITWGFDDEEKSENNIMIATIKGIDSSKEVLIHPNNSISNQKLFKNITEALGVSGDETNEFYLNVYEESGFMVAKLSKLEIIDGPNSFGSIDPIDALVTEELVESIESCPQVIAPSEDNISPEIKPNTFGDF